MGLSEFKTCPFRPNLRNLKTIPGKWGNSNMIIPAQSFRLGLSRRIINIAGRLSWLVVLVFYGRCSATETGAYQVGLKPASSTTTSNSRDFAFQFKIDPALIPLLARLFASGYITPKNALQDISELDAPTKNALVPELIKLYEGVDIPEIKSAALFQIYGSSSSKEATDNIRLRIIDAIAKIGTEATATLPILVKETQNSDDTMVVSAVKALAAINATPEQLLSAITPLLRSRGRWVQDTALDLLANMGKLAKPAIPTLIAAIKSAHEGNLNDRNPRFQGAMSAIESVGNDFAFGIDIDTTGYTVRFPLFQNAVIGDTFWVDLGSGIIVNGKLISAESGMHPCGGAEDDYTYGMLEIIKNDRHLFSKLTREVALVSVKKPARSPIAEHIQIEKSPKISENVLDMIGAAVDAAARSKANLLVVSEFSVDRVEYCTKFLRRERDLKKKTLVTRYGVGKDVSMFNVKVSWLASDTRNLASGDFDFFETPGAVKLARMDINCETENAPEETRYRSQHYQNIFDVNADGIVDIAEFYSGYENCGTTLYAIHNSTDIPIYVPILGFFGGL